MKKSNMDTKKNILLFRGQNKEALRTTLRSWKEKFIEKHGEMNLLEIHNDTMFENILSDCLSPGFMGSTRMIIFHEKLIKSDKELEKINAQKNAGETIDIDSVLSHGQTKKLPDNDTSWIKTLENIPDTNFVLFIGNRKPITELEIWIEKNASIHEFDALSVENIITYIEFHLRLPYDQASKMSDRL